jgi:hypothetical protein
MQVSSALGSGKSPESQSYMFPFHKRSRSLSPPPDEALGSINSQATFDHNNNIDPPQLEYQLSTGSGPKLNDSAFPRAIQRAQLQLPS